MSSIKVLMERNSEDFFLIPVEKGGYVSMSTVREYASDAITLFIITEGNVPRL
jgi:hypothetical protein